MAGAEIHRFIFEAAQDGKERTRWGSKVGILPLVSIHTYIYTQYMLYIYMYKDTCHTYIYIYVYIYICIYIYVYIYIYVEKQFFLQVQMVISLDIQPTM